MLIATGSELAHAMGAVYVSVDWRVVLETPGGVVGGEAAVGAGLLDAGARWTRIVSLITEKFGVLTALTRRGICRALQCLRVRVASPLRVAAAFAAATALRRSG